MCEEWTSKKSEFEEGIEQLNEVVMDIKEDQKELEIQNCPQS